MVETRAVVVERELDLEQDADARRTLLPDAASERLDAILEPDQARPVREAGAANAIVPTDIQRVREPGGYAVELLLSWLSGLGDARPIGLYGPG